MAKTKRQIRAWMFGVPKEVEVKKILAAGQSLYYILDNPPSKFTLLLQPAEEVKSIRWFMFRGNGQASRYDHEPWFECLSLDLGLVYAALQLLDNEYFARLPKRTSPDFALLSYGPELHLRAGSLTVPHAQQDLSAAKISALRGTSKTKLSPDDRALLSQCKGAHELGLLQCCPEEPHPLPFERVLDTTEAWIYPDLAGKKAPVAAEPGEVASFRNLLDMSTWRL